jgi:hypothetical protein
MLAYFEPLFRLFDCLEMITAVASRLQGREARARVWPSRCRDYYRIGPGALPCCGTPSSWHRTMPWISRLRMICGGDRSLELRQLG